MSQTQSNKTAPSLGAAAAAAATASPATGAAPAATTGPQPVPAARPAAAPAADAVASTGTTAGAAEGATPAGKKREPKRKVFVVIGAVLEFESIVQAEKHLNGAEAPVADYTVLQGVRTKTSKKVSLR